MHSCVREMLRNPKYAGKFTFGVRKWQRHPMTRKRVARENQDAEVLRASRRELAIIDRDTWDAVQAVLGARQELQGPRCAAPQDGLPADGSASLRVLWRRDANHGWQRATVLSLRCESKARDLFESAQRARGVHPSAHP
jgi:hypothetical protein